MSNSIIHLLLHVKTKRRTLTERFQTHHSTSRMSIHTAEEIAHGLILSLQMVQVSSATLAGLLHPGTTTSRSSHDRHNYHASSGTDGGKTSGNERFFTAQKERGEMRALYLGWGGREWRTSQLIWTTDKKASRNELCLHQRLPAALNTS